MKISENVEGYDWELYESPQQNSKSDSGIFMLLILRALALNTQFDFNSDSVEYFRTLIALEIKKKNVNLSFFIPFKAKAVF